MLPEWSGEAPSILRVRSNKPHRLLSLFVTLSAVNGMDFCYSHGGPKTKISRREKYYSAVAECSKWSRSVLRKKLVLEVGFNFCLIGWRNIREYNRGCLSTVELRKTTEMVRENDLFCLVEVQTYQSTGT